MYSLGRNVVKNPDKWIENDFDSWGRGEGKGVVVLPPFALEPAMLDVVWPGGRCFEHSDQLLPCESQDIECDSINAYIIYKSFYEYAYKLLDGIPIGDSWQWFMQRHYHDAETESLRVDIVRAFSETESSMLNIEKCNEIRNKYSIQE